jgi:hypothetical protein
MPGSLCLGSPAGNRGPSGAARGQQEADAHGQQGGSLQRIGPEARTGPEQPEEATTSSAGDP